MRAPAIAFVASGLVVPSAAGQETPIAPASAPATEAKEEADDPRFWSKDGWFDVSGFLDEKYGFLPIVLPITEPAVGYGAVGALAFFSQPLGAAKDGLGRPSITAVGGMATENGTWGALAADSRYWFDDRLQTVVAAVDASINLDFHGIGDSSPLDQHPLEYTLAPVGGFLQAKYRLADTLLWAGLSYAYAGTTVNFDAPAATPGLPDFEHQTRVGGLTPSLTYDSRDNLFTPTRGSYAELGAGVYSSYLGGDDEFQRLQLVLMHYVPVAEDLFLGLRAVGAGTFGDAPFYMRPYVDLRGVPIMRYQGEETAQLETELRWRCWERFSLIGFAGYGVTWNDSGALDAVQKIVSGGAGFRYELAHDYGLHAGLDVAFSRDTAAVYVQIGSAWFRP